MDHIGLPMKIAIIKHRKFMNCNRLIVKTLVKMNFPELKVLSMDEEERYNMLEGHFRQVVFKSLGLESSGLVRGKSDEIGWQYI